MLMADAVSQLAAKTPGKEAVAMEAYARALRNVSSSVASLFNLCDIYTCVLIISTVLIIVQNPVTGQTSTINKISPSKDHLFKTSNYLIPKMYQYISIIFLVISGKLNDYQFIFHTSLKFSNKC